MADPIIQELTCTKCKTTKPVGAFYRQRGKRKGHSSHCKECFDQQKTLARQRAVVTSRHLCECGCGQFTLIATRTYGATHKGQPYKYVKGHSLKLPNHPNRQSKNTAKEFWNCVHRGEYCWEWGAGRDKNGYGHFTMHGKLHLAHRIAYVLTYGTIPDGQLVRHKCDNPPCVRPDHLELGQHLDNALDAIMRPRKGRHWLASLDPDQVKQIRQLYGAGNKTGRIAEMFSVNPSVVRGIIAGKTYKHVK